MARAILKLGAFGLRQPPLNILVENVGNVDGTEIKRHYNFTIKIQMKKISLLEMLRIRVGIQ